MYEYKAFVERVIDGDTLVASVSLGFGIKVKYHFRIDKIDTPESWRPRNPAEKEHAEQATNRAEQLLLGKIVILKSTRMGIYGRYIATITLPDGRDYAEVMIQEGFQKRDEY